MNHTEIQGLEKEAFVALTFFFTESFSFVNMFSASLSFLVCGSVRPSVTPSVCQFDYMSVLLVHFCLPYHLYHHLLGSSWLMLLLLLSFHKLHHRPLMAWYPPKSTSKYVYCFSTCLVQTPCFGDVLVLKPLQSCKTQCCKKGINLFDNTSTMFVVKSMNY